MLAAPSPPADAAAAPREHRAETGDPEPPTAADLTAHAHPEAGTKQADEQLDDWQRSIMAKREAKRAIVRLEPSE